MTSVEDDQILVLTSKQQQQQQLLLPTQSMTAPSLNSAAAPAAAVSDNRERVAMDGQIVSPSEETTGPSEESTSDSDKGIADSNIPQQEQYLHHTITHNNNSTTSNKGTTTDGDWSRENSSNYSVGRDDTKDVNSGKVGRPRSWVPGEYIGTGSFGRVFKAMNMDTGEEFAVKEVVLHSHMDETDLDILLREIEVMRSLRHDNIVRYLGYEFNVKQCRLLIYQEWIPGNSLANRLSTYGAFSVGVTRSYTRQILQGLQYLHRKGVLHMDIKCANLLLDKGGVIKLADFGTAEWVDNSSGKGEEGSSSGKWGRRGTPLFMAPEVLTKRDYSTAADIWSVGGTVLQMATLKPPWADMKFTTAVQLHRYVLQTQEGPAVPDVKPVELKQFIQDCFAWNRRERPSARQLLCHPFIGKEGKGGGGGGMNVRCGSGGGSNNTLDDISTNGSGGSSKGSVSVSLHRSESWEEQKAEIYNDLRRQHMTMGTSSGLGMDGGGMTSSMGMGGGGGGDAVAGNTKNNGTIGEFSGSRRASRASRHRRRPVGMEVQRACLRNKSNDPEDEDNVNNNNSAAGGGELEGSGGNGNLAKHLSTLTLDITPTKDDFAASLVDFPHHHHHNHHPHHSDATTTTTTNHNNSSNNNNIDNDNSHRVQNPFGLRKMPSPQRRGHVARLRHHARVKPMRAKAGSMPVLMSGVDREHLAAAVAEATAGGVTTGTRNSKSGRLRRASTSALNVNASPANAVGALVMDGEIDFDKNVITDQQQEAEREEDDRQPLVTSSAVQSQLQHQHQHRPKSIAMATVTMFEEQSKSDRDWLFPPSDVRDKTGGTSNGTGGKKASGRRLLKGRTALAPFSSAQSVGKEGEMASRRRHHPSSSHASAIGDTLGDSSDDDDEAEEEVVVAIVVPDTGDEYERELLISGLDGGDRERAVTLTTATCCTYADSTSAPSSGVAARRTVAMLVEAGEKEEEEEEEEQRRVGEGSPSPPVQSPSPSRSSDDGNEAEEDPMTEGEMSDELVANMSSLPVRSHHQYDSVRQEQYRQQHQLHQPRHHQQHQHLRHQTVSAIVGNQPQPGHAEYAPSSSPSSASSASLALSERNGAAAAAVATTKMMADVPFMVSPVGSPSSSMLSENLFTGGSQSDADPRTRQQRRRRCMVDEMSSPCHSMSPLPRRINGRHRVRSSMNIRSKLRLPGMAFLSPTRLATSVSSLTSTSPGNGSQSQSQTRHHHHHHHHHEDHDLINSQMVSPFAQGQGSLFKRLMAIRRADRGVGGGVSNLINNYVAPAVARGVAEVESDDSTSFTTTPKSTVDCTSSSGSSPSQSTSVSPTQTSYGHTLDAVTNRYRNTTTDESSSSPQEGTGLHHHYHHHHHYHSHDLHDLHFQGNNNRSSSSSSRTQSTGSHRNLPLVQHFRFLDKQGRRRDDISGYQRLQDNVVTIDDTVGGGDGGGGGGVSADRQHHHHHQESIAIIKSNPANVRPSCNCNNTAVFWTDNKAELIRPPTQHYA